MRNRFALVLLALIIFAGCGERKPRAAAKRHKPKSNLRPLFAFLLLLSIDRR